MLDARRTLPRMPTALLSVYDKTGIVELAAGLHELGWRHRQQRWHGRRRSPLRASPVDRSRRPHRLPGDPRPPRRHAAPEGPRRAARRPDRRPRTRPTWPQYGIEPIDLVVVNLYPFDERPEHRADRHRRAGAWSAPRPRTTPTSASSSIRADYDGVLAEIARRRRARRRRPAARLARDAFARIAAYDAEIANWFDEPADADDDGAAARRLHLSLDQAQPLRYGENPHQQGARYRRAGATQLVGRRGAARRQGAELPQPVRHRGGVAAGAPLRRAGVRDRQARQPVRRRASATTIAEAYARANACDPVSAFGGIVARRTGRSPRRWPRRSRRCSPRWSSRRRSTTTRCEVLGDEEEPARAVGAGRRTAPRSTCASIDGGLLVQQVDTRRPRPLDVARRHRRRSRPTRSGTTSRSRGWCAPRSAATRSSTPRTVRRSASAPVSRTGSTARASPPTRAAGRAAGGVCASDAFFPFRDGLDAAAAAGITRGDPAGRQRARRRGDRRRRRARHRHGVHRRAPLPPLTGVGTGLRCTSPAPSCRLVRWRSRRRGAPDSLTSRQPLRPFGSGGGHGDPAAAPVADFGSANGITDERPIGSTSWVPLAVDDVLGPLAAVVVAHRVAAVRIGLPRRPRWSSRRTLTPRLDRWRSSGERSGE